MGVLSCVVKSPPKCDRKEFFEKVKELGVEIKDIKSVYSVNNADEITFIDEPALVHFLGVAPGEWKVTSDYRSETLVTLAPVAGQGHALVDDSVIVFALAQKCTVLSGKRGYYKEYPQIEDGRRLFRVKDIKSLGSSFRFGSAVFSVSYRGQAPTCHRCGSKEHFAKECREGKECFRCGSKEHEVKDCNGKIKCDACKEFGHSFSKCPHSYANKVSMTSDWVQFDHDASDEECFRAADAAVGENNVVEGVDNHEKSAMINTPNVLDANVSDSGSSELTQLPLGTLSEVELDGGKNCEGGGDPIRKAEADKVPVADNQKTVSQGLSGMQTRLQNKATVAAKQTPAPSASNRKVSQSAKPSVAKNNVPKK